MDFNELHLRELFSKLFSPKEESLTNSVGNSPWMMNLDGDGSDSSQQQQPMNQMDEYAQLQKLFPMQHSASDRLKGTLDSTPNRADYQPSGFNKVLASIAGMSAGGPAAYHDGAALGFKNNPEEQMKVTHGIIDEPYNKAVSDWALKLKPEQELAQAERGENTNMRIAGNNYLQNERGIASIKQRDEASQRTLKGREDALAQRDRYLDFKKYQQTHPNHVYKSDSTGHVYSVNPQSDEIEYLYNDDGEPIKSDKLPEVERLKIEQNNKLAAQTHQGEVTRQNQSNQGGITRENQSHQGEVTKEITKTRGDESRKTKATVPGKNTAPVQSSPRSTKRVKVYNENGEPGTIPESQLPGAIKKGYTVR